MSTSPPASPAAGHTGFLARAFDRTAWPPHHVRLLSAAVMAAFAVALWCQGGIWRAAAALVAVDALAGLLPWRMPRTLRTGIAYWGENAIALAVPISFIAVAAGTGASWLTQGTDWWWYLVALALAAVLLLAGGMNFRLLFSGDLAFLMGPSTPLQARTRATTGTLAPFGEESLYRSVAVTASGPAGIAVSLLGAAAFIARHHVGDSKWRKAPRVLAVELLAALSLLALVALSGSIYPALLAHLVNNAPSVLLELQRSQKESHG
ncbi:CPBP family glutamic-type intramembrane protease [Streptomyces sp. P1-3]|uniref:CPBP family glutamic-type intramembrane protease n=1 Tax=Streptomyces sp. P1-3 TaxID=3421658 RepID=UPI003D35F43A